MPNQYFDYGELRVTLTTEYDWVYDDSGSKAKRNINIWHPKSQGTLRPLGSIGISGNYVDNANGKRAALLVGVNPSVPATGGRPAVAAPTSWTKVWDDEKSGGKHNGSFWRPTPPSGYVALGDVGGKQWNPNPMPSIWCVREDLATLAKLKTSSIWDDAGSGAKKDCSIWEILPNPTGVSGAEKLPIFSGTFRSHDRHTKPDAIVRVPILNLPKDYKRFEAPVPTITPSNIPYTGEVFAETEQCGVTLPLTAFFEATDQRIIISIANPFGYMNRRIAWYTESVWVNKSAGDYNDTEQIRFGLSETQTKEIVNSAGVSVSASGGIGLVSFDVSLNYQFTHSASQSFTEYTERTKTASIRVPPYHATVLFTKHIWLKVERKDGYVLNQTELAATDDKYYSGTDLPKNFSETLGEGVVVVA